MNETFESSVSEGTLEGELLGLLLLLLSSFYQLILKGKAEVYTPLFLSGLSDLRR